jgi:hypothetical protein
MNEKFTYKDELRDISPTIADIPKSDHLLDVPDSYFELLEDDLMALSVIHRMDNNDGEVPFGYFDTLEEQIVEKAQQTQPKVVSLSWYQRYKWAVAASFLVIVSSLGWRWMHQNSTEASMTSIAISQEEALDYLQTQNVDIPLETLIESGAIDSTVVEGLTLIDDVDDDESIDENFMESEFEF